MQSCCGSDEVTNRHCEVGEVARATRARGAAEVFREVGRATRTRGGAEVHKEGWLWANHVPVKPNGFGIAREVARATRTCAAADVVNDVVVARTSFDSNQAVVARASVETSQRVVTSEVRAMGALEAVGFRLKFGVIHIGAGEAVEGGEVSHWFKCG